MSTLLLRLAGPLQSWGTESRFNTRQTGITPSKSGVIGLLAAALGLRRDSDVACLGQLRFGVRTDQEGVLLRDFQTVHIPKRNAPEITYRYYLSDAVFLAGLESDDEQFLRELEAALRAPVWSLYLGRRSCPPTQPLVLGIRSLGLYDALAREPWQVSEWKRAQWARQHSGKMPELSIFMDADGSGYGRTVISDEPISFDQRDRRYGFRAVEGMHPVTPPDAMPTTNQNTEHDAFAELEGS
ncbi:MAG: type I-E CRISPR-associated protein Cas5/CasD [Oscillospiraceae bacterium]|nr:type I-E CRISPR-associated protein Cas5/CasD [Oscillospiraceae bacterium]